LCASAPLTIRILPNLRDDLDVVCAALGPHRRRVAASGEATTAGGVMSDA
jgi:hypothetical protein